MIGGRFSKFKIANYLDRKKWSSISSSAVWNLIVLEALIKVGLALGPHPNLVRT